MNHLKESLPTLEFLCLQEIYSNYEVKNINNISLKKLLKIPNFIKYFFEIKNIFKEDRIAEKYFRIILESYCKLINDNDIENFKNFYMVDYFCYLFLNYEFELVNFLTLICEEFPYINWDSLFESYEVFGNPRTVINHFYDINNKDYWSYN